jgi:hypothetical protein
MIAGGGTVKATIPASGLFLEIKNKVQGTFLLSLQHKKDLPRKQKNSPHD